MSWADLPNRPGIYLVRWPAATPPTFLAQPFRAAITKPVDPGILTRKWTSITSKAETYVLYVGQAGDLRTRLGALVRFGLDKAKNHVGGKWLWQLHDLNAVKLLLQTCPPGRQRGFENEFLERFCADHGDWPLANRKGPEGDDRWWPG